MATRSDAPSGWRGFWDLVEPPLVITTMVVATIWFIPVVTSVDSGWNFGAPFRILYTAITIVGGGIFILLRLRPMTAFRSTRGIVGSIVVMYLITVGALVLIGQVTPQFETGVTEEAQLATGVDRGRELFNSPNIGCFLCHTVEGRGGTRGPDQTDIGTRAATRRPGLSAEEYIRESIRDPGAYLVEDFANIMPPGFGERLATTEFDDLVAYLLSLK